MTGLKIADTKTFMSKLLIKDTFNAFQVHEASLSTFTTFHIDGKLNRDYFDDEELSGLRSEKYCLWENVKPIMYNLIKGNKLPLAFKIVMSMLPENAEKIIKSGGVPLEPSDVSGLFITIKYDSGQVSIVTGTSVKIFTIDKTLDNVWDASFSSFLKVNEIPFEAE